METMVKINTDNAAVRQFIKFIAVGVINTLVTLVVIFVLKYCKVNPWVANAAGYVAGVINSFLWNKKWVFKSAGRNGMEVVRFAVGFLLCYGIQLLCTWFLTVPMQLGAIEWEVLGVTFTGYAVATLFGMCVYTISNFIFNRVVTFK